MRFTNHIARRFLTDETLMYEYAELMHSEMVRQIKLGRTLDSFEETERLKLATLFDLLGTEPHPVYLITETVHDKLDMLKVKKDVNGWYDWTCFSEIQEGKKTFVLYPVPEWDLGRALRIKVLHDTIEFVHVHAKKDTDNDEMCKSGMTFFFINRLDNSHAEHCHHKDVKTIYEFVYKLLCFVFLSENEYEEIPAGASRGTKKTEKIKNDFPVPLIVINSKWNVTSVRTEGFNVSGHFALRRCGVGRTASKMVYIQPFRKHGYTRTAKQLNQD